MKNVIKCLLVIICAFMLSCTQEKNLPKEVKAENSTNDSVIVIDEKFDNGIVEGQLETYFSVDTVCDEEKIVYSQKEWSQNQIYHTEIVYNKEHYEKKKTFKIGFSLHHARANILATKGILKMDNLEQKYDCSSTYSEMLGNWNSYSPIKEIEDIDLMSSYNTKFTLNLLEKISNAKTVKLLAIGDKKDEILLSPGIVEDAKRTIEYYNKLKNTTPTISY